MHAGGDRAAAAAANTYEAMYALYQPRLVTHCRRRLWNEADAEDAAHETLLRAYRALPDFDPSSDAWPWLTTIASRICTDLRRRATRTPSAPGPEREGADVHEEVVGRLRADILDDALRQLPARYRTPLLLREYARWSYDDIARLQGKSVGSIRSLLARGRRRLEAQVESIARTRGQWPLPGVVPPVRRLRDHFRAWRDAVVRSPHALMSAFDLSSVAGRWAIGANAALASVMTFATFAATAFHPTPAPASTATAAGASTATPPIQPALTRPMTSPLPPAPANTDARPAPSRATVTHVGATAPIPEEYDSGVGAGTEIEDSKDVVYIVHYDTVTVPGVRDRSREGTTSVPCRGSPARTLICTALRTVAEHAPEN